MASAMCSAAIVSLSARSAIVRATRRMRSCARAVRPSRLEGAAEHRRRLLGQRTEIRELRRGNGGVADVLALPVVLPLPGGEHTGADGFRGFLLRVFPRGKRLILDRLHGDLEVDAVEKRPGQAAEVLLHGFLRAGAALRAVPAARTGIHRGNQLKIGGAR